MLEYLPSFERDILAHLRLNASDAARVCNITPRQLKYWTEKGFVPTVDDLPYCYDIGSLEKAILIRRSIEDGYKLAISNNTINKLLLDEMELRESQEGLGDGEAVELVLEYLEQLEERIASLRAELPTYLTLSRLGEAARPLDAKQLEEFFRENSFSFDTAQGLALRLGYAAEEVEKHLEQLAHAGVLMKNKGDVSIYRLRRDIGGIV